MQLVNSQQGSKLPCTVDLFYNERERGVEGRKGRRRDRERRKREEGAGRRGSGRGGESRGEGSKRDEEAVG